LGRPEVQGRFERLRRAALPETQDVNWLADIFTVDRAARNRSDPGAVRLGDQRPTGGPPAAFDHQNNRRPCGALGKQGASAFVRRSRSANKVIFAVSTTTSAGTSP